MIEEWKSISELSDVAGFSLLADCQEFEISNLGNSRKNNNGNYVPKAQVINKKEESNNNPYFTILIKNKRFQVHKLVALLFLRNEYGRKKSETTEPLVVHHKNGIKEENNVTNLEWITEKEHAKVHANC